VLPVISEPALPADPALRAIADDVLSALRYSFAVAAADEQPSASGRVDRGVQAYLATRRADQRAHVREEAKTLLAAPAPLRARTFGRYAAVDPKAYRAAGSDNMTGLVGKLPVERVAVQKSLDGLVARLMVMPTAAKTQTLEHQALDAAGKAIILKLDPDLIAGLAFKKMRLFIRSVQCIEETSEIGSDEINMGGTVTDPFGNTSIVQEFEVSTDFDEAEIVNYGASKVFATWNLVTTTPGFPYVYASTIALAEKDDGGFYKFLNELWKMVEDKVKTAVAAAVGAAIGGAIGNALGAVVGAIVGVLVDWILSLFDNHDDIIGVKPLLMTLASCKKSYYDWAKLTSAGGWATTMHFKGDGGHYAVAVAFKIFTQ
jgi:hypothetical protein